MNYKAIIFFSLLIIGSFGFLKKKKIQTTIQSKQDLGDTILTKLQLHREKDTFLIRSSAMDSLAEGEAIYIFNANDFGLHTKFFDWASETNYAHYTQIAVEMEIENYKENKNEAYAADIVNAIKDQKQWYLTHPESYGGIGIYNPTGTNTYIIVIHMLEPKDYYRHCKDAHIQNNDATEITIKNENTEELSTVTCLQDEQDGGWTLLLDAEKQKFKAKGESLILDIPDLGFKYNELYWKASTLYKMVYTQDQSDNWNFTGFSFPINMWQIEQNGEKKYYIANYGYSDHSGEVNIEGDHIRGSGFETIQPVEVYDYYYQKVNVIENATSCAFSGVELTDYCAAKFTMQLPENSKLTQFTDVESISQEHNDDDLYKYYFQLYVR